MRLSLTDNLETLVVRISTGLARFHRFRSAFLAMVNEFHTETTFISPELAGCSRRTANPPMVSFLSRLRRGQNDLDAPVLFISERLVGCWSFVKCESVSNHE